MAVKQTSTELGRFKKTSKIGDGEQVVVSRGIYGKNPEYVDIRTFYVDSEGELSPSKYGVRTDIENADELMKSIANIYGEDFKSKVCALLDEHNKINS